MRNKDGKHDHGDGAGLGFILIARKSLKPIEIKSADIFFTGVKKLVLKVNA